jgi:hypothetical protein
MVFFSFVFSNFLVCMGTFSNSGFGEWLGRKKWIWALSLAGRALSLQDLGHKPTLFYP